jgi:hypothetical protein
MTESEPGSANTPVGSLNSDVLDDPDAEPDRYHDVPDGDEPTPFNEEDVDEYLASDGPAPEGDSFTPEEVAAIADEKRGFDAENDRRDPKDRLTEDEVN